LNKLILAEDKCGNTDIYWAACTGLVELLEKLWAVCKENQLNTDELSKLLVVAWHKAAARGYLEMLQRVWLWAEEVQLNTQELQRRLLLEQNKDGESAWHMAAAGGHVEVLEKLDRKSVV
jgi:ankyrin repeat protein